MFIASRFRSWRLARVTHRVLTVSAPGFPDAAHDVEADLFCRQSAMPGHDQNRLEASHVAVVGCGGLGSWIALGLARMGVRRLTVLDHDHFDRTNAPRQLMFGADVGEPKAHALARNLALHMTGPGAVHAIATSLDKVFEQLTDVTAMVVGVDNNRTRLLAATWGLDQRVPVIFAMLSRDGLRAQVFCQRPGGPCLACVLPNLDRESSAPCAAASIASCFLAAAHAVSLTAATVMGIGNIPIWRETSLDGSTEHVGSPKRRAQCPTCTRH